MIHFENVTFAYPGQKGNALDHVDLQIPCGSIFALLGPNGAGKSTLLRVLCGRLPRYSGVLHLPASWQNSQGLLDSRQYGMLIENPGIYARLTVREYLQFFGVFYELSDLEARIDALATRLNFGDLSLRMNKLSLGMRQKTQMMRTLLHRPSLVLLDEPTSNLDPLARESMWSLVQEYNQQGCTFIVCSHLLGELEAHCTHAALLDRGVIKVAGTLRELRGHVEGLFSVRVRLAGNVPTGWELPFAEAHKLIIDGNYLQYDCLDPVQTNPRIVNFLVERGLQVVEVSVLRDSLGDTYRKILGDA